MIGWKDSYAVGVTMIDTQHKKLFEIAAHAEEILLMPEHLDKFDEIIEIINELKAYTVFHFSEEQGIMEKIKYPKYFSHCTEHQDFIEKMEAIDLSILDHCQQDELNDIIQFIVNWIVEHVLSRDMDLAKYYHEVVKEA